MPPSTLALSAKPLCGRYLTGQLWAYARDDRPWGGTDPPAVAYVYAPDRKAERPIAHLVDFKGVLQVDGYGGYAALARRGDVHLACLAGRMSAVASTSWRRRARRRWRARRSRGSPSSTRSRPTCAAGRPTTVVPSARRKAAPLPTRLARLPRSQGGAGEPQERAGRSDPLRADPLGRALQLPRRRPRRDRLECGRTRNSSHRARSQKRSSPVLTTAAITGRSSPA